MSEACLEIKTRLGGCARVLLEICAQTNQTFTVHIPVQPSVEPSALKVCRHDPWKVFLNNENVFCPLKLVFEAKHSLAVGFIVSFEAYRLGAQLFRANFHQNDLLVVIKVIAGDNWRSCRNCIACCRVSRSLSWKRAII